MPVSLDPSTSILLSDGRVLVAGGGPDPSGVGCADPNVPEVFDPRTEKFTPVGPMSMPRSGPAAIRTKDGRVLLLSGLDSICADPGTVEAFDPDSGTFQVLATGFPMTGGYSTTLLEDGRVLIAGGTGERTGLTAASWLLKP